ncbi:MAG TPA: ADP-forming succinate--CoA ligase subunit beta [bacterium]|nr:ADP-forming succinate--CoA ligase subunit beta [bacterium]
MKLHEYQAKEIFAKYGLPVTPGTVVKHLSEVDGALQKFPNAPWVVKAQIHAGGRGKAGGVKLAKNEEELRQKASDILGMTLVSPQTGPQGKLVKKIFITPAVDYSKELYVSVVLDRARQCPVILASAEGGTEIEELAAHKPQAIQKMYVDPLLGLQPYQARQLHLNLGLSRDKINQGAKIFQDLVRMFLELDLSLVEVNPLIVLKDGNIHCLDAKLAFEDNGLARHKEYADWRDADEEDARELEAAGHGLSYISLDGNIGCLVNGAGLAMATADAIQHFGGSPANFLDVGGSATTKAVTQAFKIILSDSRVKAILVNIFGGIMKCDVIAQGIIDAAKEVGLSLPLVIRLEGTNVEQGKKLLSSSTLRYQFASSMDSAAKTVVAAAKEVAK